MKNHLNLLFCLTLLLQQNACQAQQSPQQLSQDFDRQMPFDYKILQKLSHSDTSPGWYEKGKQILLTGTVYERDGKTPAQDIILYYYQTDADGIYSIDENEPRNMPKNRLGQTHGHIRGWVQTDSNGNYSIFTIEPGSYPSRDEPAHVHVTVREPKMKEPYYLDDFVFDNDPLLNSPRRLKLENRGGSGIIRFVEKDGLSIGERNITLGLNIPDYPVQSGEKTKSGKEAGEDVISFTPFHAYGPDKGTKTCPICKYGWYHGVLYFVGNKPNWVEIKEWLTYLDLEGIRRQQYLKVYFVYGNQNNFQKQQRFDELEALGEELKLQTTALTFVPSFTDKASDIYLNEINSEVDNTFILYKRSRIVGKFINLKPTQENFAIISKTLDQSENEYFLLGRSKN